MENAIAAKASRIEVTVVEEPGKDRLEIEIKDDGIGMDEEIRQKAVDPFLYLLSVRVPKVSKEFMRTVKFLVK